jgi:uncharacterized protein YecT (DUF1311 family)
MNRLMRYILLISIIVSLSNADVRYSKQYDDCIENSGGVTSLMLDCIANETNKQDILLNTNYKKVILILDKARRLELKKSQRLWMKYRDAKCNFFIGLSGGTIDSLNATSCFLDMIALRADELNDLVMD